MPLPDYNAMTILTPEEACAKFAELKFAAWFSLSPTAEADKVRHSDYELAFQMSCDSHRIENQRGTILQLQAENRRLREDHALALKKLAIRDQECAATRAKWVDVQMENQRLRSLLSNSDMAGMP